MDQKDFEEKTPDDNQPIEGQMCYDELTFESQPQEEFSSATIEGQIDLFEDTCEIKNELESESQNEYANKTLENEIIEEQDSYKEKSMEEFENQSMFEKETGEEKPNDDGGNKTIDGVVQKSLDEVLHDSMIPYTECVVMDRALPRVEDGLKPVQRRILYSMIELGLYPDKQYRKSARIVGDCMGKYHPHGDSSVYDAMVRMAQEFSLRAPLVDGHGNFGSVDGDSAAAMRYTEAKLTPLALELLRDLDKDTVRWSLNFDDTIQEPDMLPGRFPNLLVNGASGIAVGVATNIPPHNLAEVIDGVVAYIDNPKITLDEMMKIIKAPDFPTGGLIIPQDLKNAYATGKGKIILRAKVNLEKGNDGRESLVITELPYQVNKAALLQKIAQLKEENKEKLNAISEIRDESDRNGMRAVIRLKKDSNAKQILAILMKSTQLETSFAINMVAIAGGKPKQMGLLEIISYYTAYQREIIIRKTKYDLNAAKERAHIVEGLLIAIKNIDEVVKIIKKSSSVQEARQKLKDRFNLSDKQTQAILDMRLARLVNLEVNKLEEELKALKVLIKELTEILNSKKLQFEIVKKEILEIKKKYKNDRRSEILKKAELELEEAKEDKVSSKDCLIAITAAGLIKRIPLKNYSMAQKEISDNSSLYDIHTELVRVKESDKILIITDKGNALKINASEIPEAKWREKGTILTALSKSVDSKENAIKVLQVTEFDGNIIFFTKKGMVKRSLYNEIILTKSYYQVVKVNDCDSLINVEYDVKEQSIIMISSAGNGLNFEKSDIPIQGRVSAGVRGMNIEDKDIIVFAGQASTQEIVIATDSGYFKKLSFKDFPLSPRYRKGLKAINLASGDFVKFGCLSFESSQLIACDLGLKIQEVKHKGIAKENRLSSGKQIIKKKILGIYDFKN